MSESSDGPARDNQVRGLAIGFYQVHQGLGPRLLIDDNEVNLDAVWIHSQDDPDPGGHRYCLTLPSHVADDWMTKLGLRPSVSYDGMEHLSRDGLFCLSSELAALRMERGETSDVPWLFVINTISQIAPIQYGVEVRGICSPFVRSKRSAEE